MGRLFGTDGIRGIAGEDLTADLVFRLGQAAGIVLSGTNAARKVLVGCDSRISGPMLESALSAGLMATGFNVFNLGIVPTPVLAFLTKQLGFPLGCVISASHNPIEDNGIKFIDHRGMKVEDEVEETLEDLLESNGFNDAQVTGNLIGQKHDFRKAVDEYVKYLSSLGSDKISGLNIVVDAAFGAASIIAPAAYTLLGARVTPLNCQPDGSRINVNCGATNTQLLKNKVIESRADLGIALDGDADRAILVDEQGQIIDGDQILAMWGLHLLRKKALPNNTIVGTLLSNKGLEVALQRENGRLIRASVGDKYVLREMLNSGARIGGEQSGHIIFLDYHTTGDGILTGLMVAMLMKETGKPLSTLGKEMTRFPQVQLNIMVRDKKAALNDEKVKKGIEALTKEMEKRDGRLLIRPSGTESLIRVMTEAPDESDARRLAEEAIGLFTIFSETGKTTEI